MRSIGRALAEGLAGIAERCVIALEGELGAGKTTLVGAVLSGLGHRGHVRSPTYTLVEPYELAGRPIYHFDLYRLADPEEVEALAMRDLQTSKSVFLIEWPERAAGQLPPADLWIQLRYAGDDAEARELTFVAASDVGRHLLASVEDSTKQ